MVWIHVVGGAPCDLTPGGANRVRSSFRTGDFRGRDRDLGGRRWIAAARSSVAAGCPMDPLDTAVTTTTGGAAATAAIAAAAATSRCGKIRGSAGAVARRRRAELRRFRLVATSSKSGLRPELSIKKARPSSSSSSLARVSGRLLGRRSSSAAVEAANFTITVACKSMDKHGLGWQGGGDGDSNGAAADGGGGGGGGVGGGDFDYVVGWSSGDGSGSSTNSSSSCETNFPTTPTAVNVAAGGVLRPVEAKPGEEQDEQRKLDSVLDGMVAPAAACNLTAERSPQCVASDACPPHGAVFICGRRREMEDAVAIVPNFMPVPCGTVAGCDCGGGGGTPTSMSTLHFFGVYDGHGGPEVAGYCRERMHRVLEEELSGVLMSSGPAELESHLERAMVAAFLKVDAQVGGFFEGNVNPSALAPETVGSTAVVAVVGSNRIIVANCGDSRAVLSRGGRAIPLTADHKPDREDELARVEAAGGRVFFWNGFRVLGVLAMSRAIGDRYLKPFIIPEPDVTCTERSVEDECLILASDGLWDVVTNEVACEIARKCLNRRRPGEEGADCAADVAAGLLTKLAIARGSTDNISVVVVDLRSR